MPLKLEFFKPDSGSEAILPYYDNSIPAGFPSPALDYIEQRLDLSEHLIRHPESTFIVKVKGTSMINNGIFDDDLLIVDKSILPTNGQTVIAEINGEFTVKKIEKKNGKLYLVAANSKFDPIPINEETEFMVWGVVTYAIHKISK